MEAVDVLRRVHSRENRLFVDMLGQGELDEDAIHGVIRIKAVDQGYKIVLRRIGGNAVLEAFHARLDGRLDLGSDVSGARRMFSDQNDGKAGGASCAFVKLCGGSGYRLPEVGGDCFAVDDAGGHTVPVARLTATPPSNMRRIWISSSRTSGEKSMPPKSGMTLRIGR